MQLLCWSAVSRMACGRSGSGTRRRITIRGMPILNIDQSKSAVTAPDTGPAETLIQSGDIDHWILTRADARGDLVLDRCVRQLSNHVNTTQ
jgi:hypothetical protein